MQQHDLSPARFLRRRATVDPSMRSARGGHQGGNDVAGAWVHLKAWMRVQPAAPARQRPAHG